MSVKFRLEGDAFVIEGFNQARPFSSFLPGIAGECGKPMWVFYANRGQCLSSFGVHHKGRSMLEFYPANKAYQITPLFGFRTFVKLDPAASSAEAEYRRKKKEEAEAIKALTGEKTIRKRM